MSEKRANNSAIHPSRQFKTMQLMRYVDMQSGRKALQVDRRMAARQRVRKSESPRDTSVLGIWYWFSVVYFDYGFS